MKKLSKKRILIIFTFYTLFVMLISFSFSYFQMREHIHTTILINSQQHLLEDRKVLLHWLDHFKDELKTLSRVNFLRNFLDDTTQSKSLATDYLLKIAQAHSDIMQARFIDTKGNEIIRIDRPTINAQPRVLLESALQNKKERYYFTAINRLKKGEIWFSDIDLNMENHQVQIPFLATLRIGIPLFSKDKRLGMFIINIFIENLLKKLSSHQDYQLYLIDNEGNFIIHPNKAYNFSKYLHKEVNLTKDFPLRAKEILQTSNYISDEFFTQEILLDKDKRYILIAKLDQRILKEKDDALIENFLSVFFLILLMTLPLAYFIVRHIDDSYLHLTSVFDNLGDGIFVLNHQGYIVYSNKKAQEILEFSYDELDNKNISTIMSHCDSEGNDLSHDDSPILDAQHAHTFALNNEHTFTTKSGRCIHVEFSATPLNIEGMVATFKDITARKILEKDLISITKRLRDEHNLFIEGPAVVFTWLNNDSWSVEYVSANVINIFGFTYNDFTSGNVRYADCIHPADQKRVTLEVESAIKDNLKAFTHKPYRIIHKDGSIHWLYDRTVLVRDDNSNKVTHFHGFIIDITEQQILERKLSESEENYRLIVEDSTTGIFKCTKEFKMFYSNPAVLDILELDSLETLYETALQNFFLSKKEQILLLNTLLKEETINNYKLRIKTSQGNIKHLFLNAHYDGNDISGTVVDMTAITQAQMEIEKLSKVIDQIDDLVTITDVQGYITYANQAFYTFTGYSPDEIIGQTPRVYKSSQHSKEEIQKLWKTILNKKVYRSIITNKKKDGTFFYEEKTITPMLDAKNEITAFVSTGKDITEQITMQEELRELASTDYLTKLYNRLKFEELFHAELDRYKRHKRPLSIVMFDIDFFKKVNDTYGHDVGDSVLIQLSQLILHEIRAVDIVARWGGEEFMLLLPETDVQSAIALAEKLREKILLTSFDTVKNISCSFGVTQIQEGENFLALSQRVDTALYEAKNSGRNCVKSI